MNIIRDWLLPVVFPVGVLAVILYYVNSRPLRQQEGARFLLDLIDSALRQGQSIEHHIVSLARSRDAGPGLKFHLLAAYLEQGYSLVPALEKVPELVPPQILAILKVGQTLGDFKRVLPACRHLLEDGTSRTRALINYQVAFGLILNPCLLIALPFVSSKVVPVFKDIASQLRLYPAGVHDSWFRWLPILFASQLALVLLCFFCAIFLLGGTRFALWLEAGLGPVSTVADWLSLRVPWRRQRLQRDFSAMLGLLLDTGVPEAEVLRMAAFSTANRVFIQRAERAAARLRHGVKLPEAVQILDDSGEFRWRLENGAHGRRGFFSALQGWQSALDAKACQQEQTAAQVISTSLVLLNAAAVALLAVGVFQFIGQLVVSKK